MMGVETRGETKIVLEVRLGARHPFYLLPYYHACILAPLSEGSLRDILASMRCLQSMHSESKASERMPDRAY
jgi:hypothetical protein